MHSASTRFFLLFSLLLAGPLLAAEDAADPVLHIGGTGGAYFLAEPGELVIDLEKRDSEPLRENRRPPGGPRRPRPAGPPGRHDSRRRTGSR